jgi:hypothetical protein
VICTSIINLLISRSYLPSWYHEFRISLIRFRFSSHVRPAQTLLRAADPAARLLQLQLHSFRAARSASQPRDSSFRTARSASRSCESSFRAARFVESVTARSFLVVRAVNSAAACGHSGGDSGGAGGSATKQHRSGGNGGNKNGGQRSRSDGRSGNGGNSDNSGRFQQPPSGSSSGVPLGLVVTRPGLQMWPGAAVGQAPHQALLVGQAQ